GGSVRELPKPKTKQGRIRAEENRLFEIFSPRSARERGVIEGLIRRAAYMRVTLEDLERDIDERGLVEMFTQSDKTDPYERERPSARLYNTISKNYQTIMKQLSEFVEKSTPNEGADNDGFDEFVASRE
ncbi:hypothetical protein, partial [Ruminococcus sp.]|uniref:hypothetical protein n=1 Tax=Ruminococcus sp. TaxID=41978 RepID=UPI0038670ED6